MRRYYRIDISSVSVEPDGKEQLFDTERQEQPTLAGVHAWLLDRYNDIVPNRSGLDDDILVYRFENADWSHSPVSRWQQIDYVHVSHVTERDTDIDLYMPEKVNQ